MTYRPDPINTSNIKLPQEIVELTELIAKNAHDIWAQQRLADGWQYGPRRDDAKKEHPGLVPYESLEDSEKQYDRNTVLETIKVMIALGYRVEKA